MDEFTTAMNSRKKFGIHVDVNGDEAIYYADGASALDFKRMQELVGGHIEVVSFYDAHYDLNRVWDRFVKKLILNENGAYMDELGVNELASKWNAAHALLIESHMNLKAMDANIIYLPGRKDNKLSGNVIFSVNIF